MRTQPLFVLYENLNNYFQQINIYWKTLKIFMLARICFNLKYCMVVFSSNHSLTLNIMFDFMIIRLKNFGVNNDFVFFQFSRSSVGGSRFFLPSTSDREDDLRFESRFESGNLAKAVKITETYYELSLRTDLYTNRHMQWFYFRIENTRRRILYR